MQLAVGQSSGNNAGKPGGVWGSSDSGASVVCLMPALSPTCSATLGFLLKLFMTQSPVFSCKIIITAQLPIMIVVLNGLTHVKKDVHIRVHALQVSALSGVLGTMDRVSLLAAAWDAESVGTHLFFFFFFLLL